MRRHREVATRVANDSTSVAVLDLVGRVARSWRRRIPRGVLSAVLVVVVAMFSTGALADGPAVTWGLNAYGQVGDGTTSNRLSSVDVAGTALFTSVACGLSHSVALRADGTVWTWGRNHCGQLGDGSNNDRWTPVQVAGLEGVTAVAAGGDQSVALRTDGTLWAWGWNGHGVLGDGTTTNRSRPVQVAGLTDVTAVAFGSEFASALRADGTVYNWGMGKGLTPVKVAGLAGVTAIANGWYHLLALRSDGTVWGWGDNTRGQLGDGTATNRGLPVQMSGLTNVTAIAGGHYHSLALRSDGTVWSCGWNVYGTLGDGTTTDRRTVVNVVGLTDVIAIAGGQNHSLAIKSDGTVGAWGYNSWGSVGDGTTTDRWTPVQVPGLVQVAAIACGRGHSLAVLTRAGTTLTTLDRTGSVGTSVALRATLSRSSDGLPIAARLVSFSIDGSAVGSGTTDATGLAEALWPISVGTASRAIGARFDGDATYESSSGTATLIVGSAETSVYVPDRTGTITDAVVLKGYLYRASDKAYVAAKGLSFSVAGTAVGSATTDAGGQAQLTWTITAGDASRTIQADFAGDAGYLASTGYGMLSAQTTHTKVYVVDRLNVKVKTYTVLKAYLYTTANAIIPGKTLTMSVDGSALGSQATNSSGYISFGYTVPEGSGAGNRVIGASWVGNAGYTASSNTGKLGVVQGNLYIWPYVRSAGRGRTLPLKAYVRSLPDYVIQPGKSIAFSVNGTGVGSADVAADGWASVGWFVPWSEPLGSHTATAAFAGDSWYAAVSANTTFNVVP